MQNIAIIGAGITGLTLANELNDIAHVQVFEKSRGLGGRMATRRVDDFHFDHGAQYFIAKSPEFKSYLTKPLAAGAIANWHAHFVEFDGDQLIQERNWDDTFPHFVGTPTMSALAKFMSANINVRKNIQVSEIQAEHQSSEKKKRWNLLIEDGASLGVFDWVLCTSPVEQARALMPSEFSAHLPLSSINMRACFAVMLGFDFALDLPFQAALVGNADISWIAQNDHKPYRPDQSAILIQSNNDWAQIHAEDDKEQLKSHLISEAERVTGICFAGATYSSIHRWLYANTVQQKDHLGEVYLDMENQLAAAGDWCGNARVESAFLHGLKLANDLKLLL